MFLQRVLTSAIGIALSAIPVVAGAAQGPGHGWHQHGHRGAMYNTQAETRLSGSIAAVIDVGGAGGCCCGAGGGTHVTLKTATESIEVHLGPTVSLREKGINLAVGDQVEILGSRFTMRGVPVLLARQIKKGETTWTLRAGVGPLLWNFWW